MEDGLRLSRWIYERVKELVRRDGTSISQFLAAAATEKVAALDTADYLEARARKGTRARLFELVRRARDIDPEPQDRLPGETPE